MDGSAQLTEVRFSRKRQGYDPDEVDNFLERVGEKVYELQEKVRAATQRAEAAERKVADAEARAEAAEAEAARAGASGERAAGAGEASGGDTDDLEETLKRTLVLAQRTADTAIKEARAEAERIVSEAQATADRLARDTDATCKRKLDDADRQAQQRIEAASGPIKTEVLRLEERQQKLVEATDALEAHLEAQRTRIRDALGTLQAVVDDPAKFATQPRPSVVADERATDATAPTAPTDEPAAEAEPADDANDDAPAAKADEAKGDEGRPDVPPLASRPTADAARGAAPPRPAPPRPSARPADDGGPPTARIDLTAEPPVVEDGNLLDELRKAVGEGDAEPSDADDPDEALQAFFEQREADLEVERRSRFGRRL